MNLPGSSKTRYHEKGSDDDFEKRNDQKDDHSDDGMNKDFITSDNQPSSEYGSNLVTLFFLKIQLSYVIVYNSLAKKNKVDVIQVNLMMELLQ